MESDSESTQQLIPSNIMDYKAFKIAVEKGDFSPKSWTHEQLLDFIRVNGLDKYQSYIKDENHTGSTILGLTKDVLVQKMSVRDSVEFDRILGKLRTLEKAFTKNHVQPETTLETEPSTEEYIQMESIPTQQFIPPRIMDDKDFKIAVEKAELSPKSWTHEQLLEFFGFNGLDKYVHYIKAENHTGSTILGLSREVLLLKMSVRDCLELIRVLGRLRTLEKAYTTKNVQPEMTHAVEHFDINRTVVPFNIGKSEMRRRATFNDLPWHYTHKVGQDGKVQNTYNSKIFYGWVYTTGLPDCPERLETSPALNLENPASFKTPQRKTVTPPEYNGPDECWEGDTSGDASGLKSTVNADDSWSKPNSTPMTCYNCGELGHGSRNCTNPPSANSRGRGRGRGVGRGGGFNNSRGGGRGGWNNNQSSNTSFPKPSEDESWDEESTNTPAVKSVVNVDESWDNETANSTHAVKSVVNVDESWDNETANSTHAVKSVVNVDESWDNETTNSTHAVKPIVNVGESWDDDAPNSTPVVKPVVNAGVPQRKSVTPAYNGPDECWETGTSSNVSGLKSNVKADDSWSKPNSTPMTCYNCGELGHGSRNCTNPPSANSRGRGRGRGVGRGDSRSVGGFTPMTCYNCGELGHGSRNCTNPPSANSRGRGRGAGRIGGFENFRGGGGRWNNNNSSNSSFPKPSMDDSWDDDSTNTPVIKPIVNVDESWDEDPTSSTPVVKPVVNADVPQRKSVTPAYNGPDECWEDDTSSNASELKSNVKAEDSWSKPNSTPMTCYNCGELGHGSRNCPNPPSANSRGRGRGDSRSAGGFTPMTCYNCGEQGHGSRNCTNPPSANSRGRGRGRGVGRGDSRSGGGFTPMTCYNCGEQGHGSRNCTNPPSANSRGRGRGGGRTGGFENSRGGGGRWNNNNSSNSSFPKPSMDDSWDDDSTNTPAVKAVVNVDESWDEELTNSTPEVKPVVNADASYSWDDIVPVANVSTSATKRPASFADSGDDVGTSRSSYTKQKASTDESWVGPTPSKRQRPSIDEESWD